MSLSSCVGAVSIGQVVKLWTLPEVVFFSVDTLL